MIQACNLYNFRTKAHDFASFFITRKGHNKMYFIKFLTCEFLNVVTLLTNFFITNKFLNGNFSTYGQDVLNYMALTEYESSIVIDPRCNAFPTTVSDISFLKLKLQQGVIHKPCGQLRGEGLTK